MLQRKAQVVMLPTENKQFEMKNHLIWKGKYSGGLLINSIADYSKCTPQHLYFTTDEEIKRNEWFINTLDNRLDIADLGDIKDTAHRRKIVATTNPNLWGKGLSILKYDDEIQYTGVAKIEQDFIEAYVREQGKITEVMLECEEVLGWKGGFGEPRYKKVIGEQLKLRNNGSVVIHKVQQKQYTRNEVIVLLHEYGAHCLNSVGTNWDITTLLPGEWMNKNYPQ